MKPNTYIQQKMQHFLIIMPIPNLPNPVLIAGRDERGEESPMGKRQDMEMPIPRRSRGDSA